MPKKRLTQIAKEHNVSFAEAMHLAKFKLPEESVSGKGKATWIDEEGQEIIERAFDIPEIVPKYLKGKVMHNAPNPHYIYVYIKELGKKVPVIIGKRYIGRLNKKNIDIEAIQDNKGVSYRYVPKQRI